MLHQKHISRNRHGQTQLFILGPIFLKPARALSQPYYDCPYKVPRMPHVDASHTTGSSQWVPQYHSVLAHVRDVWVSIPEFLAMDWQDIREFQELNLSHPEDAQLERAFPILSMLPTFSVYPISSTMTSGYVGL